MPPHAVTAARPAMRIAFPVGAQADGDRVVFGRGDRQRSQDLPLLRGEPGGPLLDPHRRLGLVALDEHVVEHQLQALHAVDRGQVVAALVQHDRDDRLDPEELLYRPAEPVQVRSWRRLGGGHRGIEAVTVEDHAAVPVPCRGHLADRLAHDVEALAAGRGGVEGTTRERQFPGEQGRRDGREPFPPAGELVEVSIPDGQQAVEVRAAVGGAFGQRPGQPERPDPLVALADRQQPVEDRPVRRQQGRQRGRAAIDIHWPAGYLPVRTPQAAERSPGRRRRRRGCWMAGGL